MKQVIKLFLIFFLFNPSSQAQGFLLEKTFGYQNDDIFFETIESNDGGYLSLGWTKSIGNGETDFFIIKSAPDGNKIWEKTYGGFDLETGISVKEFASGNLLLSGTTRSFGSGLGDCIFIVTDSKGNRINEFYYGSFGDDYLRESIITQDNKIIFTGFSDSFGNGMKDIILGKIDLNGKLEWIRNFGGSRDDEGWHVAPTQDGGFIVSGFTTIASTNVHSKNIKVDHSGKVIWEYDKLQKKVEYGINSTIEDQNGDFVSAHTVQNSNSGKSQIELYRLSKSGQFISSKIYESNLNAELRSMVKTNCGYAIALSSWDQRIKSDISIMFTDQNLNEIKKLNINKPGKDDAWKTTFKNNKIIVSGSITNELTNSLDGIYAVIDMGDCKPKNIECINIKITEDAAIGYHDFLNTSSTNYGNAIQNAAYAIPGSFGGSNVNRALLQIDLNPLQNITSIVSAKLNLYAIGPIGVVSGHEGKNEALLQKVIQPWSEFTVTWDNQPQTTNANEVVLQKSSSPTQDYTGIDVLPLIKDMIQSDNYGIMLKLKEENLGNVLIFYSSDYTDNLKHPTLDVCYSIEKDTIIVKSYTKLLKCKDEEIKLLSKPNSQWNTGEIGQSINVVNEGFYIAELLRNDTLFTDSFFVENFKVSDLNLGDDVINCEFKPFLISASNEFRAFLWSTGDTINFIEIKKPGAYWLNAIDQCNNILRDTLNVVDLSSDTTFISKNVLPGESIFINNIQYDTPGNYVLTLSNKYDCDSIIVIDIKSANSIVYYDFNKCIAIMGSSNMDYSEFTPRYTNPSICTEVNASIVFRENATQNKHSCTPGINNTLAMCVESLNSCNYIKGDAKSIKINLLIEPKNNEYFQLQGLSFFNKSPDMFDWINGDKGLNNFPTKFGIRILQDGNEIFSMSNLSTNQNWKQDIFNFMENNKFIFQEKTQLTVEILPYCLVGNLSSVSAWDIDELNFYGTCVPKQFLNITGKILSFTEQPIHQTLVYISDISTSESKVIETDVMGSYQYNIKDIKQTYTIQPENNNKLMAGVSTLDLVIIQRHILGLEPFKSPHQYIAADIDNNKKVSASDLVELKKNILGIKNGFKNNQSWRFNQKAFDIKIENPFEIKEKIEYSFISNQLEELDFTAIKIGDLSSITYLNETEPRSKNELELKYHLVNKDGKILFEVFGSTISDIYGFEFNINLENAFIIDIISETLKLNMDDYSVNGGNLKISKVFDIPFSVNNNELLFSLVLGETFSNLSNISFVGEFYVNEKLITLPLSLKNLNGIKENGIMVTSIHPNPFQSTTNVHFEVNNETNIVLQIFDQNGRLLSKKEYVVSNTDNQIVLNQTFFQMNSGIYYLQVISNNANQVYKLISVN